MEYSDTRLIAININLKVKQEQFIQSQIKRGKYETAEQLISEALELLKEKDLEDIKLKYENAYKRTIKGKPGPVVEALIEKIYKNILQDGDIAIDGGANVGRHTIPLAKTCGQTGKVYAFDVIPDILVQLTRKLNEKKIENVTIFEKALCKETGLEIKFNYVKNIPALSGIKKTKKAKKNDDFIEIIKVETIALDDVIPVEPKVKFIKLDLEGGEFNAILGAKTILLHSNPMIIFENARQNTANLYSYSCDEFFSLFDNLNYNLYTILGERFFKQDWDKQGIPGYFVAVPSNSLLEEFLLVEYPRILDEVLNSYLNSQ